MYIVKRVPTYICNYFYIHVCMIFIIYLFTTQPPFPYLGSICVVCFRDTSGLLCVFNFLLIFSLVLYLRPSNFYMYFFIYIFYGGGVFSYFYISSCFLINPSNHTLQYLLGQARQKVKE